MTSDNHQEGPLAGLRVLELGSWVAGPHAATLYGDFGAEVIKVEAPGRGDPARAVGTLHSGVGLWWLVVGRNKRSATLDLRSPRGRELLLDLVPKSDILVENMRPGKLAEMGFPADELQRRNRGLVIVRVSAFGQTGPLRHRNGYDPIAQAYSGLLGVTGHSDGVPVRAGMPVLDYAAATIAALGGLIALYHRDAHGGQGQEVDMSLYEAALPAWADNIIRHSLTGHIPTPAGNRHPDFSPGELFPSRDKRLVQIVAIGDPAFVALCGAMGRPDLAGDARFITNHERARNGDELFEEIAAWTSSLDASDLIASCASIGIPATLINNLADLVTDEHARDRGNFISAEHPKLGTFEMQGVIPHLSVTPGTVTRSAPDLGADNDYVYGEILGLPATEIEALRRERVI
jgi:crotonobetainyl-CoA:carnitine CoA-transferase CaiB-like acyl-CoA transferase